MANFSPASETNPIKIKLLITWRGIQSGLKILARFLQTGLGLEQLVSVSVPTESRQGIDLKGHALDPFCIRSWQRSEAEWLQGGRKAYFVQYLVHSPSRSGKLRALH